MPELVSWGPFTIQTGLLAVVAASVTAMLAVRALSLTKGAPAKASAELLQNAAFLVLIVWKFGHVLFAPSVVWDRPLALLMMNGGGREASLAVAAAIFYLFVKVKRSGIPWRLFADLTAFGATAAAAVYCAIAWKYGERTTVPWGVMLNDPEYRYHPVSAYALIVAVLVTLLLWLKRGTAGDGTMFRTAALYMGSGLLLVSFWDVPPERTYGLLSAFQWRMLVLAGIGIISPPSMHNKVGKEMNVSVSNSHTDPQKSLEQNRQDSQNAKKSRNADVSADKKLAGPNRPSV
ncbi:prolipoprotein diacylglyceryl transferase family protein [Paenibacillus hodogayensis]|uniref:Prolipoprotein diacylglyceryl transferase family protein n=1 Tax=Paenibacillus hodogayensis TaxID=279208 RepID=A0ABV5W620_9BACL